MKLREFYVTVDFEEISTMRKIVHLQYSDITFQTDDNDTTDVEESEESGSGPKRPKLDDQPQVSHLYRPKHGKIKKKNVCFPLLSLNHVV